MLRANLWIVLLIMVSACSADRAKPSTSAAQLELQRLYGNPPEVTAYPADPVFSIH